MVFLVLYYLLCPCRHCKEDFLVFNILNKIEVYFVFYKVWVGIMSLLQKGSKGHSICHLQHLNKTALATAFMLHHASVQPVAKGERIRKEKKNISFKGQIRIVLDSSHWPEMKTNAHDLYKTKQKMGYLFLQVRQPSTLAFGRLKDRKGMRKFYPEKKKGGGEDSCMTESFGLENLRQAS